MNYLQMCQRVAQRAGVSGAQTAKPLTVTDQVGKLALVCGYVAEASRETETEWDDFTFMRSEIDFSWDNDTQRIDPSVQHPDVDRFNLNTFTVRDQSARKRIFHRAWEQYRIERVINIDTSDDLPSEFSIDKSGLIHAFPVCTHDYILRAEVVLKPKILALDADEPHLPAEYRDSIVHRALMFYFEGDEAWDAYNAASKNYERWMERVEDKFLPHNAHGRTQSNEQAMVMITE